MIGQLSTYISKASSFSSILLGYAGLGFEQYNKMYHPFLCGHIFTCGHTATGLTREHDRNSAICPNMADWKKLSLNLPISCRERRKFNSFAWLAHLKVNQFRFDLLWSFGGDDVDVFYDVPQPFINEVAGAGWCSPVPMFRTLLLLAVGFVFTLACT